jgi:hypothetical protein
MGVPEKTLVHGIIDKVVKKEGPRTSSKKLIASEEGWLVRSTSVILL